MSVPQRPLLPPNSGLDDKPPRLGVMPFPFCASSSPSSVFPMFPNFQQVYNNFMQAQLLHLAQQQQQQLARAEASPGLSEGGSTRSESPSNKKLAVDDDGCSLCPACGDKLPEAQWAAHVEMEKAKLAGHITSVKERILCEPSSNSEQMRRKRELELMRIRSNQQKRLVLKRGTASLIRDCLTPFSRQSNDETGSSSSPEAKKDDDFNIKCSSCSRICEYGIVATTFDRPRCQSCFDVFRAASAVLLPISVNLLQQQQVEDDHDDGPASKKARED